MPRSVSVSLRTKLIAGFMAVSVIPLGMLLLLDARWMRAALLDNGNQVLLAAASQTAYGVDSFFENGLAAIGVEAQLPAFMNYIALPAGRRSGSREEKEVVSVLHALGRKNQANISSYALLDRRGRTLLDTFTPDIGTDRSHEDYFRASSIGGINFASPVNFSDDGTDYFTFSAPVRDTAAGEIVGVLCARYSAVILEEIIVQNGGLAGKQSFAILLDENHLILAHGSDTGYIFKTAGPLDEFRAWALQASRRLPRKPSMETSANLPGLERALSRAEGESFFEAALYASGKETFSAAVTGLVSRPWLVVFAQPQSFLLAAVRTQMANGLLLGLAMIAMVAFSAAFAARFLMAPIIHLTSAAKKVADGDLEVRVPEGPNDEIGALASTFNFMTGRLLENLRAVRDGEARYRALYEDNPSMYFTVDARGTVLSVNRHGAAQLGYKADELMGQSVLNVFHPEDRPLVPGHLEECVRRPLETASWELRKVRKDGSVLWVKETARAVPRQEGGEIVVLIVCEDISAQKKAEEERIELEAQLRQVQKMESIGFLAGGIAHDFNNLLTPIIGYADMLLLETPPEDPRHDMLNSIKQAAARSRDLTRQLLAFGRKQTLSLRTVDLGDVVKRFVPILKRTIRENIDIVLEVPSQAAIVRADVGQIDQVLTNLAVNSQDAMPEGGTLSISVETAHVEASERERGRPELPPGSYVTLCVRDTGCGMEEGTMDRVFEPFFTTKVKGTGLGLPTVYGIVKQHHGEVVVHSEPEKGSTFTIFLPRFFESAESAPMPSGSAQTPLKGTETIMVVEDDPLVRNVASEMLGRLGYRVLMADGAESCMRIFEERHAEIDLIMIDVIMPHMNGRELFHRLSSRKQGLKVLFVSGYSRDILGQQGVLDRGVQLIQKPLTLQELSLKIRQILEENA